MSHALKKEQRKGAAHYYFEHRGSRIYQAAHRKVKSVQTIEEENGKVDKYFWNYDLYLSVLSVWECACSWWEMAE